MSYTQAHMRYWCAGGPPVRSFRQLPLIIMWVGNTNARRDNSWREKIYDRCSYHGNKTYDTTVEPYDPDLPGRSAHGLGCNTDSRYIFPVDVRNSLMAERIRRR